ncbi:MAG: hypothetical protein IJ567_01870 [Lachnospiraceae bacterium]|nr:hypothetical protein [Lachnospiraceae bacterium]
MVYREVCASKNGRYLLGLTNINSDSNSADAVVYETENFSDLGTFKKVPYVIGGKRAAISDDGKYFVTATYDRRKGMALYSVDAKKRIWTNKEMSELQTLQFSADGGYIIAATNRHSISYVSIETGKKEKTLNGKQLYENPYGADIIEENESLIVGDVTIKYDSFGCNAVAGVRNGVAMSPVSKGLYVYDYDGRRLWENTPDGIMHFLKILYDDKNEILYGLAPEAIISFYADTGQMIDRKDFDGEGSGFCSEFISDRLLGSDKKIYDLQNGKIDLSEQQALFDIGYTIESYVHDAQIQFGDEVQIENSGYDEQTIQSVPERLRSMYREYRSIVVPYMQVYPIEDALKVTREMGIREKGYVIFGYSELFGYLLCAIQPEDVEDTFIYTKSIDGEIEPDDTWGKVTSLFDRLRFEYRVYLWKQSHETKES